MWIVAPEASHAEAASFYVCGPHFVGTSEASQGLLLGLGKKKQNTFKVYLQSRRATGDSKS